MGRSPRRFVPSVYSLEVDSFDELGITVLYDQHGRSDAISFVREPDVDVECDGYQMFDHPAREVREWARAKDPRTSMMSRAT